MGLTEEQLRREVESSPVLAGAHLAGLTAKFVAIPSVNGEHPESALVDVIADELDPFGFDLYRVGDESRPSLAAVIGTSKDDRTRGLVLNGHLDTVPVDDPEEWLHPPFAGVIDGGRVYGRGACDMKGGLAVAVAVGQWLASREAAPDRLVLHFAMGEERGEPGTEALIEAGFVAPAGVVLEPTDLAVATAQRGLITLKITITGRAGHASRRDLADNPLRHLPAVLATLEGLEADPSNRHDLLGIPAWTPTSVRAGVIPSMIPGACELLVDRRMIPGETVEGVVADLEKALGVALPGVAAAVEVVASEGIYDPAEIPADARVATELRRASGLWGGTSSRFGTPYSSDVRHLVNQAGVEAVTFGPGRFSEMHARDEHVDVADLERAARAVAVLAARLTAG